MGADDTRVVGAALRRLNLARKRDGAYRRGMQLAGRLRTTTLGDLLGSLHRASATGTLELAEEARGRTHSVYLTEGKVSAVALDGASRLLGELLRDDGAIDDATAQRSLLRAVASQRLLGEVLVRDFAVPQASVGSALRKQLVLRLSALDRLVDARVTFHVARRVPAGVLAAAPLEAREFLPGRRRARERSGAPPVAAAAPGLDHARRVLGVGPAADTPEIRRAFRRLALTLHPDLHPAATPEQRRALELQLARASAAYKSLVA